MDPQQIVCSICQTPLNDLGKLADFYDDYSPYMGIHLNKLEDGDPISTGKPECVHLFRCPSCNDEQAVAIKYRKLGNKKG